MASVTPTAPPAPACRSCAATLRRCWVCGEVVRCLDCQQCLRCEGLLDEGVSGRLRTPDMPVNVPAVRLKRSAAAARPRPTPPESPPRRASAAPRPASQRPRARRVQPAQPPAPPALTNVLWYVRTAVVPILMLLCAYCAYNFFHKWSGLALATMCVVGFYLPYVVLTPVRRTGEFFPLGDEGPALPIGMLVGGVIVGMVAGIALGVFFGEVVGRWGGIAVAGVVYHFIYYTVVAEAAASRK